MFFSEYVHQYEPSGSVAEVVRLEEKPWQGEPATQTTSRRAGRQTSGGASVNDPYPGR